jgi:hypothetical protein
VSSKSARAISPTTSAARSRRRDGPRLVPGPSRRAPMSEPEDRSVGSRPSPTTRAIASTTATAIARGSTASSAARGNRSLPPTRSQPTSSIAAPSPTAPAATPSTTHSAVSSRSRAPRPPPSAVRMASSRERAPALARASAATLTQAMSSTNTAATVSRRSCGPVPPRISAATGWNATRRQPRFSAGYVSAKCAATAESACAPAAESTPARSRPTMRLSVCTPRCWSTGSVPRMTVIGAQRSAQTG